MSHFCVMVIGDDYEKQLAPFQEGNVDDGVPEQYVGFHCVEEEYKQQYENDTVQIKIVEVPFTKIYKTFEEYMADYHSIPEPDPETGKYGYWCNPNAKWDWYTVGGRWQNYFKVQTVAEYVKRHFNVHESDLSQLIVLHENNHIKYVQELERFVKSAEYRSKVDELVLHVIHNNTIYMPAKHGEGSIFRSCKKPGYADRIKKGYIDIDTMFEEATKKAIDRYNAFKLIVEKHGIPPKWSDLYKQYKDNIDEARNIYHSHPAIKALDECNLLPFSASLYDLFHIELGVGDKALQACIEDAKCNAIVPFAFVMNGKWYEKGEMGWWGMVHDEKLKYDWSSEFLKMWEALPDDTLITLVDCHI